MGSCLSKKNSAKKQQQAESPKHNAANFTAAASTVSQSPPPVLDEKPPLPEDEAVKEVLLSETSKTSCYNANNSINADTIKSEVEEKPEVKEVAVAVADAEAPALVKKNAESSNSLKKKGSFKASQPNPQLTKSSSAKEDLDAILIQCGRLSRSSSGKASNDTNNNTRQYSGSKRHATEEAEEVEQEKAKETTSRPSHRRSSSRDLTVEAKRSTSRDRVNADGKRVTGRRISPSPGRRAEPSPGRRSETSTEKARPGKQNAANADSRNVSKRPATKRATNSGDAGGVSTATSRSRSPAPRIASETGLPQTLSRSSSRKAEQSPFRRPLNDETPNEPGDVEIRNEPLQAESSKSQSTEKKISPAQISDGIERVKKEKRSALKDISGNCNNTIRDQLLSCRAAPTLKKAFASDEISEAEAVKSRNHRRKPSNEMETKSRESEDIRVTVEEHVEKQSDQSSGDVNVKSEGISTQFPRSRSQRRSREQFVLDSQALFEAANPSLNSTEMTAFTIPASVSKACSILEAVADLNSSVNSNSSSIYSNDKSFVSDSFEQGKSARFLATANFGSEEKLSANLEVEKARIIKDFHRNLSPAGNSNVDWTEQCQEESAGSNGDIMGATEVGSKLSSRRLHRYHSSEEGGLTLTSFSNTEDSTKTVSNIENSDEKTKTCAYSNQSSARYLKTGGESSSRSNLMPVITLGKKEFQNSKRANNFQNGRASSEIKQNVNHLQHNFFSDLNFKSNSSAASELGDSSRAFNSFSEQ